MKKILMIDDEQDFCEFVKRNLELTGKYSVMVQNTGEGGINAAIKEKPDLILLDILMPVIGGFEVLEKLMANKETKGIPVVMLTAVEYSQSKERAKDLEFQGYLVKPVQAQDLLAKIERVLGDS